MADAIKYVLTILLAFLDKAAASTATLIDDKIVAYVKLLTESPAFASILLELLANRHATPTSGYGAAAAEPAPFPLSYAAAAEVSSAGIGQRLRDLVAKLSIPDNVMEMIWPLVARALLLLF